MSTPSTPALGVRRAAPFLARLALLQAAWSYERMQAVGLATALAGVGRRLTRHDPDAARAFLERHLGYFNTNPVAACGLVGAIVRLEEEVADRGGDPAPIDRLKLVLAGPAAAWGDTLFWATLRPVSTALAVVGALLFGPWSPIVYLVGYNAVHFYWRARLLAEGYARGAEFGPWLSKSGFRTGAGAWRRAGIVLFGVAVGFSLIGEGRALGSVGFALGLALTGVAVFYLRRPGQSGTTWGFAAVAAGLIHAVLSR